MGLAVGRHGEPEPGVRPIDQPVPAGGEERAHEGHPVPGDRGVAHARHVALGRRGVEDDRAAVVGQGDRTGLVDVDLRAPDLHEGGPVEADELAPDAVTSGLAGDEHVVVGLELVARHVVLVGLAVAHEDVRRDREAHRREVLLVLVDVEHDPHALAVQEPLHRLDGVAVHGDGAVTQQDRGRAPLAGHHRDGVALGEAAHRLVPLVDLVDVLRQVGK